MKGVPGSCEVAATPCKTACTRSEEGGQIERRQLCSRDERVSLDRPSTASIQGSSSTFWRRAAVSEREGNVARIDCDVRNWPVIVVTFPGAYSDADFDAYLADLSMLLTRRPEAIIIDTRAQQSPTATQRQRLAGFVKTQWKALSWLRGIAFVVNSRVARHALTMVSWVVSTPCPIEIVPSMAEARCWLEQRCALELSYNGSPS